MKKWADLTPEQRKVAIDSIRYWASVTENEEEASWSLAAADELENPTWDDEPAPAPGEIIR